MNIKEAKKECQVKQQRPKMLLTKRKRRVPEERVVSRTNRAAIKRQLILTNHNEPAVFSRWC